MDDPLIFVRAVHFVATLSVTGVALFNVFVAQPVLRPPASPELRASVVRRLAWIAWIGLALALLSGAAWFVLVSASISDQPLETVLSDASILQAVLLDTDFGRDWLLRLLLIALLAGLLAAELAREAGQRRLSETCRRARGGRPSWDIGLGRTRHWRRGTRRPHSFGRRFRASDRCGRVGRRLAAARFHARSHGPSLVTRGCARGELALFRLWDRRGRRAPLHWRNQYLVSGGQHSGIDRN